MTLRRTLVNGCAAAALILAGLPAYAQPRAIEARFSGDRDLVIDFPQPIQAWSNQAGDNGVRLQPDLSHACRWDSDTRLACRFDRDAPRATRYRIDLAAGLRTYTGANLPAQTLFAESPRPTLGASIDEWRGGMPVIELRSTTPLTPEVLRSALRLWIDGSPVAVPTPTLIPKAWKGDSFMRFRLELPPIDGASRTVRLDVVPGLRSTAGPLAGTQDATLLKALANEPFLLRSITCPQRRGDVRVANRDGAISAQCLPGMPIHLEFSRVLSAASRNWFAQHPPAGLKMSGSGRWWPTAKPLDDLQRAPGNTLIAEADLAEHAYQLTLGALQSEDGARLAPVDIALRTEKALPQLQAPHAGALIADPAHPPALVEAINAGDATIEVDALGARDRHESIRLRGNGDGTPTKVDSPLARRALAEGGWVRWTPQQDKDNRSLRGSIEPAQFAAPAFDLYAVYGLREVLVWANEWDRDAPVPGAEVELLLRVETGGKPRVVARATTGEDGVALLRLPDDVSLPAMDDDDDGQPTSMWLVRASQGARGRRAVLPLADSNRWMRLGRVLERLTWGVSDRPMYHAGETVHYRLWQRDRNGARLQPIAGGGPLSLRLRNENEDKTVLQWQAMPSPAGDVDGLLELPRHLTDGTYCIGVGAHYQTDGACFFVGTYRAQDLWAQLTSPGGVLRDGQRLSAELKAGYYSGGEAAGVDVRQLDVTIYERPFEEAYPQYAQYEFIDVHDDAFELVDVAVKAASTRLDGEGRMRLTGTLPEGKPTHPPFGQIEISAEVSPAGREGTVAADTATLYARYPAYVGLRTIPAWPDGTSPVDLDGIVVDASGRLLPDATITVDVELVRRPGDKAPAERLGQCTLRAGQAKRCDFIRPVSGLYRFVARSGDAAPAQVRHYLWTGDGIVQAEVEETALEVDAADGRSAPLHAMLRQPFPHARALFVFASQDRIDGHRVEPVAGNVQRFELARPQSTDRPSQRLEVFVRSSEQEAARIQDGFRSPAKVEAAKVELEHPDASPAGSAPVSVRFEPVRTTPGMQARVVLHNDSDAPRDVVVSVVDDALRALAQRWLNYADPHGSGLLGGLKQSRQGLDSTSFDDLVDESPWRYLLPWQQADEAAATLPEPAKSLAAPANIAPPEEPAIVVDEPSPVDVPAREQTTLDRIEVTGSRIKRADLESREAKAPDPGLRPRDPNESADSRGPLALARVRTRFADTAAWHPDLRLAPGETRTLDITLPDNLTRWRAVAWSSDDGDGFAMAEATLETGLPIESRLQAPVRVYPGDRSRLIAHVRQSGDAPVEAHATLRFDGPDAPADRHATLQLASKGGGSFGSTIAPAAEGTLTAVAAAHAAEGQDAVAQLIEVASPRVAARKVLAGWLDGASVALDVPTLPAGASNVTLHVSLQHGVAGLVEDWTGYMRSYPHRCWEQILSRAVAAALALERGDKGWGDAAAVVREALDNAAVFQESNGGFRYFTGGQRWGSPESNAVLTAYTVEAFVVLRRLGHPVDADVEKRARDFLANVTVDAAQADDGDVEALTRFAYAATSRRDIPAPQLDRLWQQWDRLPLPAQVATARALAGNAHPAAVQATQRLLAATVTRGPTRVLRLPGRYDEWMSSSLREQCSLIALLGEQPLLDSSGARRALIAGLTDLHAGGGPSVDTHSGATCLMALRDATAGAAAGTVAARVDLGSAHGELQLAPDRHDARWEAPLGDAAQLRITTTQAPAQAAPASFIAVLDYQEDARIAQASAMGLAIGRRYAVFRDGDWRPVEHASIREGDWVRITLALDSSAPRRFVAVTDQVPGGLRPTDLSLSGVVVRDIERASNAGSPAFATRKLDAREPKFYAESLPAGHHEVHYFAVAGNGGEYLAPPAMAELMYGGASSARSASSRIRILTGGP